MAKNQYLEGELEGLTPNGNYAAAGTNAGKIDVLLNLLEEEHTTAQRGFMDEMSPQANRQMIVELRALKASLV